MSLAGELPWPSREPRTYCYPSHCPHVVDVLERRQTGHRCGKIVGVQKAALGDFQLPEPWSGDLEHAPILFLGSNPGYARSEDYPSWSWADDEIADFFVHRFSGGRKERVKDGLYTLLRVDGHNRYDHKKNWVRYWAAARRRASELLENRAAVPGANYALSEVVHCKSKGEAGVAHAAGVCVSRYLERPLAASGARVVVCLGKVAGRVVRGMWGVSTEAHIHGPIEVGGRERYFAFLPHPNARGPRSFTNPECVSPRELLTLRQLLR